MKSFLPFSFFHVFFFAAMWASKTLHPIFFENSGHLANFGLSYSAMALAGYFSFLTGSLTDRMGAGKTLGLGSMLYAIGMFLRAFPDSSVIAITSGVIAGVGASMALTSLRLWMLDLAVSDNKKARWVGLKSSTTALGTALGCTIAGLLPGLSFLSISMKSILLIVPIILFVIGFTIYFFAYVKQPEKEVHAKKSPFADIKFIFQSHNKLATFTSVIGVLTGFYVSFVSPYLPLIMKEKGLSMSSIGLSIGAFSLFRFFVDPFIAKWLDKKKNNILPIFLTSEFCILIITGIFALTISKEFFVGFLLVRSFALGFSTISEELLWIQKFPRESVGLLFGINQSSFFLGDFIGGLVNGALYQKFGLSICVAIALVTIAVNFYLFFILFNENKTSLETIQQPSAVVA